ncbi:MAG: single-stranded-DNA-specific exonuclease RecJ [Rhodospirillales bacterium]|nr:single-stranded-DNA-specific exonuclease RecJ [Rhodospirillales bacterium]MDH3909959.1 single-stranded-DNA-specific exonuclease RecJ [Rhodospirillales bacterium]MDH3916763.1 single-stranded-DNA-specific exonuclease RecJ [Rhodospirillales bacterium]MDH3969093.1 single-stranded-DNA-specific exonuclease RecJ [Rhodospirillales bacterium]
MAPDNPAAAPRDCVLGVERSLAGRRWEARLGDPRLGLALAQDLELPEVVGRALAARGVGLETAEAFLTPRLRDSLPDPLDLKDMDRAVERIVRAVRDGEQIAVFGDYDVDGATSAALLKRFLAAAGADIRIYIPDRLAEGYGPNAPALRRLKAEGVALAITVDCGISAFAALEAAAADGLDMVVVDHHAAQAELPPAAAIVNPNRLDESGEHGQLAAVGVAFLLTVALNRALREGGWYRRTGRGEPDLRQWLDLVALGTVCDVVPLTGLNRVFVAQGLKVMARRGNRGLAALADVAGVDRPPEAYHAGFLLGPRINAGGRVGVADLGARLLTTEDPAEAAEIAGRLDALNRERRAIEQAVLDQALTQAEGAQAGEGGLVLAAAEGWHPGVIGIVASRLKDRTNLPALVVALDKGVGKGSARSVPGVDLGREILAARQAGLLVDGGGHPMAAGLTVSEDRLVELQEFLDRRLAVQIAAVGYRPALGLDGALQPRAATAELLGQLERLAPFGVGNAEPRFALPSIRIVRPRTVGEDHLRCILTGPDGGSLKAIAFRAFDGALGAALAGAGGLPFHVAGKLRADHWAGPGQVQFIIEDAAPAAG